MNFIADKTAPTPSALDNIPANIERCLRIYGCEIIQEIGILLKVPQVAVATGCVLFQRFYFRKSMLKFDVKHVAPACLFLATKIEETQRQWKDVVQVMHYVFLKRERRPYVPLDKSSFSKTDYNYWDLKTALVTTERYVLKELGFMVYVEHPHKFVLSYLKILDGDKQLAQQAWSVVNDSLRTTACIYHKPETIAATAIYIAARQRAVALPEAPNPWWLLFDVDFNDINAIGIEIMQLYRAKAPAAYIDVKSLVAATNVSSSTTTTTMNASPTTTTTTTTISMPPMTAATNPTNTLTSTTYTTTTAAAATTTTTTTVNLPTIVPR